MPVPPHPASREELVWCIAACVALEGFRVWL